MSSSWTLKITRYVGSIFLCSTTFPFTSPKGLIITRQENQVVFQENGQVMKNWSLDLCLDSIYSCRPDSGPDCFGCSSVIRDEKPPAEGCVTVDTFGPCSWEQCTRVYIFNTTFDLSSEKLFLLQNKTKAKGINISLFFPQTLWTIWAWSGESNAVFNLLHLTLVILQLLSLNITHPASDSCFTLPIQGGTVAPCCSVFKILERELWVKACTWVGHRKEAWVEWEEGATSDNNNALKFWSTFIWLRTLIQH